MDSHGLKDNRLDSELFALFGNFIGSVLTTHVVDGHIGPLCSEFLANQRAEAPGLLSVDVHSRVEMTPRSMLTLIRPSPTRSGLLGSTAFSTMNGAGLRVIAVFEEE